MENVKKSYKRKFWIDKAKVYVNVWDICVWLICSTDAARMM